MQYKNILVTGGAGFVGSNICIKLKEYYSDISITAFDNLARKGSELNLPRLEKSGVVFIKADVRFRKDLEIKGVDLIIECSAEPSVMAGVTSSPEYILDTNVLGAINCFEVARKNNADIIFLSTSRVYPIKTLNDLLFEEKETRFELNGSQKIQGASVNGISETFPIDGVRSLYGATKLTAELLLEEYRENYKIKAVINRCGLISGPWQMGKMDQGIIAYWLACHIYNKPLSYIGYGGEGKQVRDVLHIDDLFDLLALQIDHMDEYNSSVYNVGGGKEKSVSLSQLTALCQKVTGKSLDIKKIDETRQGDIRIYITDNSKISAKSGWKPKRDVEETVEDTYQWMTDNKNELKEIFA